MNEHTRLIIQLCTRINREAEGGQEIVAYSVDAGSHIFVFTLNDNKDYVMQKLNSLETNDYKIYERIIETKIGKTGSECISWFSRINKNYVYL